MDRRTKNRDKMHRKSNNTEPAIENGSTSSGVNKEKKQKKSSKRSLQQMSFDETDQLNLKGVNTLEEHNGSITTGVNKEKKQKKSSKRSLQQMSFDETDQLNLKGVNALEEHNGSTSAGVNKEKKQKKSSKRSLQQTSFDETDQLNVKAVNELEAHNDKSKKHRKDKKNCKSSNDCENSLENERAMQLETYQPFEDNDACLKGRAKKSSKKRRKDSSSLDAKTSIKSSDDVIENDVYQISSGDDDNSKGMKKWLTEYHESRLGLKELQQRIDDYITAHEAQLEQEKKEREAQAAEGGWTVVVHQKGRKKTTDAESGVTVGSVAPNAAEDRMSKKKKKDVGLDFYRFQRREAQRNEVLMLQSKFEQDKKRIQQLRAARKFRPY